MKTAAVILGAVLATAGMARAEQHDIALLSQAATHASAGRHTQAIALYEQMFARTSDDDLLPILGVQYRRVGARREAVQHFCLYLLREPQGEQAWFVSTQVRTLRAELGDRIDPANVCGSGVDRIDFAPKRPAKRPASMTRQRAGVASAR
jgi:hypothetical protein